MTRGTNFHRSRADPANSTAQAAQSIQLAALAASPAADSENAAHACLLRTIQLPARVDNVLRQPGEFDSWPQDRDDEKLPMRLYLLLAAILLLTSPASAWAGPPSYLLLRPVEAPDPHDHWGEPPAAFYDARATGYAYGYFGAGPRTHWSRHFGVQRMYTQWAKW